MISCQFLLISIIMTPLTLLYVTCRYVIWTEIYFDATHGRVVQASMDGLNESTVLVNTSGVTIITIDYSAQTIYWYSGYQLGSVRIDGSNSRIINTAMPLSSNFSFFLSHLENDVVYYTIYGQSTIYLVYGNGTLGELPQTSRCFGFSGSKVIGEDRQTIQGRILNC